MNITHLPSSRMIHVEADIPLTQRDEFNRAISEINAGARPRMDALERDLAAIRSRALLGLHTIEDVIRTHPTSDQAKSLVRFLAGIYNGHDYPFDLTELRGLDIELANACLDYLNYDRLGETAVHEHLTNGAHVLKHWLKDYGIESASRELE